MTSECDNVSMDSAVSAPRAIRRWQACVRFSPRHYGALVRPGRSDSLRATMVRCASRTGSLPEKCVKRTSGLPARMHSTSCNAYRGTRLL